VGVLVTMKQLFTRTWFSTSFTYDLLLEVVDATGTVIALSTARDDLSLGAEETVTQMAGSAFSQLFGAPDVRAALRDTFRSSPTKPAAASVSPVTPAAEPSPAVVVPASSTSPRRAPLGETPPTAPAQQKCSVDQVLKMKEMRMSDQQIKAACPD
jgi:hypothetical protein